MYCLNPVNITIPEAMTAHLSKLAKPITLPGLACLLWFGKNLCTDMYTCVCSYHVGNAHSDDGENDDDDCDDGDY